MPVGCLLVPTVGGLQCSLVLGSALCPVVSGSVRCLLLVVPTPQRCPVESGGACRCPLPWYLPLPQCPPPTSACWCHWYPIPASALQCPPLLQGSNSPEKGQEGDGAWIGAWMGFCLLWARTSEEGEGPEESECRLAEKSACLPGEGVTGASVARNRCWWCLPYDGPPSRQDHTERMANITCTA